MHFLKLFIELQAYCYQITITPWWGLMQIGHDLTYYAKGIKWNMYWMYDGVNTY